MNKSTLLDFWFDKGNKNITIKNFKYIRKRNLEEYGHDPDINTKRKWGIHTNGAKKGNPQHTCLDWQLDLGHIHINYTDFDYNRKYRK
jgi:hypothetical protein